LLSENGEYDTKMFAANARKMTQRTDIDNN